MNAVSLLRNNFSWHWNDSRAGDMKGWYFEMHHRKFAVTMATHEHKRHHLRHTTLVSFEGTVCYRLWRCWRKTGLRCYDVYTRIVALFDVATTFSRSGKFSSPFTFKWGGDFGGPRRPPDLTRGCKVVSSTSSLPATNAGNKTKIQETKPKRGNLSSIN